jgi:hypothetical protein
MALRCGMAPSRFAMTRWDIKSPSPPPDDTPQKGNCLQILPCATSMSTYCSAAKINSVHPFEVLFRGATYTNRFHKTASASLRNCKAGLDDNARSEAESNYDPNGVQASRRAKLQGMPVSKLTKVLWV